MTTYQSRRYQKLFELFNTA